ncbi:MAG: Radical domain protein [Firmicutes bacterium]|nr:Radical domain protein [Bacillota bacterium]
MAVELRPFGVACNISCRYCYQNPLREAGNIRQHYDMERMRAAIQREGGPFTLFGGEPLLMPLDDLEELFRWGLETYGTNSVQTNGTLIGDAHVRLFQTYNVHVGISIDGPGELNELRWHGSDERTSASTQVTLSSIARLCREHRPPGLIVTLHRMNAAADRLPRLYEWVREMDALGVRTMRLHLLEVESEEIRRDYSLTTEENMEALLGFAQLQTELKHLRFDVLDEIERGLLGRDQDTSCVWHACDPLTTPAVRGVEGNGQSSNCGRTNKDGIDFIKADSRGYERYIGLYHTPQEHGGCAGCRFFLMCKGQCPGTAIDGDWRNRSELCEVWKRLFMHAETRLVQQGELPLSVHPLRPQLEQRMLQQWQQGRNSTIQSLHAALVAEGNSPAAGAKVAPHPGAAGGLPYFVRHAFVGEAQRATWAPRFDAVRSALGRIAVLAVARQMVPIAVSTVVAADVFALHTFAAAHDLHTWLLPKEPRERLQRVAIGGHAEIGMYKRAREQADQATLDELTGIPSCCRKPRTEAQSAEPSDPVWAMVAGHPLDSSAVDVDSTSALSPVLRCLGLDVLGYDACSFHCPESLVRGATLLALGREAGMTEAMDWLAAIMDWPVEWTALHGIAEVKTGVLKVVYRTGYTPDKVIVRYHGRLLAPDAARGLSFAYRTPRLGRRAVGAPIDATKA